MVLVVFICSNAKAQGVEFMHDLDKALEKAKAEDKMVFVDFYTSWCGPCKQLSKNVFTTEQAGTFFNTNFINCKVQCDDKGVGVELGKKYEIMAYPTLMFLNKKGEIVHSTAGAPDINGLIDLAKIALDPEKNLLSITKMWDAGNRKLKFVNEYFSALNEAYLKTKAKKDFETYFNSLSDKDKISKNMYALIKVNAAIPHTPIFTFLEEHKTKFSAVVDAPELDKLISDTYLWNLQQAAFYGTKDEYKASLSQLKAKGFDYYDEFEMFCNIYTLKDSLNHYDIKQYQKDGTQFLNKYGANNDSYTLSLTSLLGNLTGRYNEGADGIKWMETLLKRKHNTDYLNTYFYILSRNRQFDKAVVVGNEMRQVAIDKGQSPKAIDDRIAQILAYKKKLEQKKSNSNK